MNRPFSALWLSMSALVISVSAAQTDWKYTALGDSIATGYLAQAGYVTRFEDHVQTDNGVSVTLYNLAQNGSTSARLLTMLRSDSVLQSAVASSQIITWNIGLNDYRNARTAYKNKKCRGKDNQDCLREMVTTFRDNWNGAVIEILNRRRPGAAVRTMDLYNPWVSTDRAANTIADVNEKGPARGTDLQVLNYYFDQMNSEIALSADANAIPCARVHALLNGADGALDPAASGYLASDGIHLTDAGHAEVASLLRSLGYAPLR